MHARLEASAPTSEACPNDSLYEVRSTKVGKLQLPLQYTNTGKNWIRYYEHFNEIVRQPTQLANNASPCFLILISSA